MLSLPEDLLCPSQEGGWLDIDNVSTRMAREVRELGFPGFHSHSLRHSFVSYLLNEMKVPVSVVKQIAGHSSTQTTLTYYSVATDRQLREAMNGISNNRRSPQ
jgi:integrase